MTHDDTGSRVERCLRRTETSPDSAPAWYNLGLAYTATGRVEPAEKAYRRALEVDADLVEAWVNLGGVLMLRWDFQGSIDANREALKRRDDIALAHYNVGQASLYLGHAEAVVQANRRVVELEPDHAAGHYFLAVGLLATGRTEEARAEVARAKALGHSPAPEFLKALDQADGKGSPANGLVNHIGSEKDSSNRNRR